MRTLSHHRPKATPFRLAMAATVIVLLAWMACPGRVDAQLGAGFTPESKLELTTASAAARAEFWAGLEDFNNIFTTRASTRFKKALELDSSFGLARVLYGGAGFGLTERERHAEMDRGVADAAHSSAGESLLAIGLREWFKNRPARARAVLQAASELVPGDPNVAFLAGWLAADGPEGDRGAVIRAMRDVIGRFPDFAPAYNVLAYDLWRSGERAEAVRTAAMYLERAPNHPNSHDSFAELLQWDGRLDEALEHYQKALELDPGYTEGYMGVAAVRQLQGKGSMARAAIQQAITRSPDPDARLVYLRGLASSWLLDGNLKAAQVQLSTAAEEARKLSRPEAEALIHSHRAALDGAFGDGSNIATFLALTVSEDAPDEQHWWGALGYALAGKGEEARRELANISSVAGVENRLPTRKALVEATLLLKEGKAAEALRELENADPQGPIVRAVTALCHRKLGNVATALALRGQLLTSRELEFQSFRDVIARALVQKLR